MRESCEYGSVRGARGNSRPYRVLKDNGKLLHLLPSGRGTQRRLAALHKFGSDVAHFVSRECDFSHTCQPQSVTACISA
jgi:hypothetical protein